MTREHEVQIRVTKDQKKLARVGGGDYAFDHAGKTYAASIDCEGWAVTMLAKFDPTCFTIKKKRCKQGSGVYINPKRLITESGKVYFECPYCKRRLKARWANSDTNGNPGYYYAPTHNAEA